MSNADVMYDEATKLKEQGELEQAVSKLLEIVEAEPEHVISHSALGIYLQKLGRSEEAYTHAKRVTELEPNDPFSYTQLSVVCQRCGMIQEAEDAMAKASQVQQGGDSCGGGGCGSC